VGLDDTDKISISLIFVLRKMLTLATYEDEYCDTDDQIKLTNLRTLNVSQVPQEIRNQSFEKGIFSLKASTVELYKNSKDKKSVYAWKLVPINSGNHNKLTKK